MKGLVLWVTGLPGSGKSTIAEGIRNHCPDFVILRMDELRGIVTPQPTYSETERDIVYRSIVYAAKTLSELSHAVIIDATGNRRKWRELARELLPNFAEIYLKCSIETCAERERTRTDTRGAPREIYEKGKAGWPVPGVQAVYEEPLNPEVTIETDKVSVEEALSKIKAYLERRFHG